LFRGVSGAFGQTGIGCLGIGGCEMDPRTNAPSISPLGSSPSASVSRSHGR
jgi:hypothetical protein